MFRNSSNCVKEKRVFSFMTLYTDVGDVFKYAIPRGDHQGICCLVEHIVPFRGWWKWEAYTYYRV